MSHWTLLQFPGHMLGMCYYHLQVMPVPTVIMNKVVLMITTYMYGVVGSPIPSGCRTRPSTPLTCERIFWATWPWRCPRPGTLIIAAEVSVLLEHVRSTVALKGHHYISFSLHYINFDLCEKNIIWLCIHNYIACIHYYLACIHKYLACIHNYLACIHNYLACIHKYLTCIHD